MENDKESLDKLGYAQELLRTMGGFSNFAMAFSVVSILTGAITLYDYGLKQGGPAEMTFGWPVVTIGTTFVVLSMAELASALPSSGTMYHWSCLLGGKGWGWLTAWLYIVGYFAALAGIDYGCAQFLLPLLGIKSTESNLLITFAVLLFSQALINHVGIKLVAWLNDLSVSVHIIGILAIIGALLFFAEKHPLNYCLNAVSSEPGPYWWCFTLGLLQAQWTLTGYDSSASVSEETHNAAWQAPWGMVIAVAISAVSGYALLLAITLSAGDISELLKTSATSGTPTVILILTRALGSIAGSITAGLVVMAMWFCGLSTITGCSRVIFAFARDEGMPFSSLWRRVSRFQTPAVAIWGTAICAFGEAIYSGAYSVVTSISVIGIYLSYIIPVCLAVLKRLNGASPKGPWHLGQFSTFINIAAIIWTFFICAIVSIPNELRAGKAIGAIVLLLGIWYAARERRRFKGPGWLEQAGERTLPAGSAES